MTFIYILYGLLIIIAVVLIPIRISLKRKHEKEIGELSLSLDKNMRKLTDNLRGLVSKEAEQITSSGELNQESVISTLTLREHQRICRELINTEWLDPEDSWDKIWNYERLNRMSIFTNIEPLWILQRSEENQSEGDRLYAELLTA